jgi:neurotransmitter:Na+ symporter, NSS family
MENRAQWGTRLGFILAASGSAIGLGNIWRFPGVAYESGGGAFFIPYLFALLTAGIPLLILEFTLGHKYRGSAPRSLGRASKGFEWIGWWSTGISFVISTYYGVIIAWAIMYSFFSFSQSWGDSPLNFFVGENFLQLVDAPTIGGLVPIVLIPLLVVWLIVLATLFTGVKKGIERLNKIFIPTLFVVFFVIVIRAITLEGAGLGLNEFFSPDWGAISNPKVWVAAYSQIFFSLSIGFAIMITYASYLNKKSDITNNAFITGFLNSSFELLAGIGVFAVLGYMAVQQGVAVSEVGGGNLTGVLLAFSTFPEIISQMPMAPLFGFLFFISLFLAGTSSLISITETYVAGVSEKFNISRTKAVAFGGGLAALISILYATKGGLNLLDTVDHFINSYGVALAGLVEVVAIAWFMKGLRDFQGYANSVSDMKLGAWWRWCLQLITPVVLGYMLLQSLKADIIGSIDPETGTRVFYGKYPVEFLFNWGWLVAIGVILVGALFTIKKWPNNDLDYKYDASADTSDSKEVAQ